MVVGLYVLAIIVDVSVVNVVEGMGSPPASKQSNYIHCSAKGCGCPHHAGI
jgi:hypothetical protein